MSTRAECMRKFPLRALAGTALVGFVVAACPLNASADVVEVTVKLTTQNSKCTADIDGGKKVAHRTRDALLFSFDNACTKDQAVLVCAKPKGKTTHSTPWAECVGLPQPPQDPPQVGKEFKLKLNTATALCSIKWPDPAGSFTSEEFILTVTSTDSGGDKCDGFLAWWREWWSSLWGEKAMAPELALEVDP